MDRDDVPGLRRIFLNLLTQPRDVIVDRARNRTAIVSPNFVEQLIACDDFASTPDQVVQDFKLAS